MTRAKEQMLREGQYPHDVGLLDDTFIMPSGKNRPRWFTNYKDRMRLERKRLRIRFQELTGYASLSTSRPLSSMRRVR